MSLCQLALVFFPGIDLENIVYYKDETHYFVMTAKKKSLLKKGVIKQVRAARLEDVTSCRRADSPPLVVSAGLQRRRGAAGVCQRGP